MLNIYIFCFLSGSEESAESSDDGGEAAGGELVMRGYAVSLPLVILAGHQGVVASAG